MCPTFGSAVGASLKVNVIDRRPLSGRSADVQVHLRFQWVKQVTRGQTLHMDLQLKGLGISVMGGLQDELFNLTIERVKVGFCMASKHLPSPHLSSG